MAINLEEDQSKDKGDELKLLRNGPGWRLMRLYELLKTVTDGMMFCLQPMEDGHRRRCQRIISKLSLRVPEHP